MMRGQTGAFIFKIVVECDLVARGIGELQDRIQR